MLAQGDQRAGLAALKAWRQGGTFAVWKRAFIDYDANPTGPVRRVPTTNEQKSKKTYYRWCSKKRDLSSRPK